MILLLRVVFYMSRRLLLFLLALGIGSFPTLHDYCSESAFSVVASARGAAVTVKSTTIKKRKPRPKQEKCSDNSSDYDDDNPFKTIAKVIKESSPNQNFKTSKQKRGEFDKQTVDEIVESLRLLSSSQTALKSMDGITHSFKNIALHQRFQIITVMVQQWF